ncbi:alkaline phosphatase [Marinicella sp. W31]|uniref:alkaline phosphatase n=1 Tax=Marinicella sp. W31 TaxID=3023713 RepID=UPI003757173F
MKKNLMYLLGAAGLTVASLPVSSQSADDWYSAGQQAIQHNASYIPNTGNAKNVILFIGDGMGVSTVTAARILDGQKKGMSGEENQLSFEKFPHLALSKVYNTNQQTPDSAGTMTAMVAGVKTKAGVIGVEPQVLRRNCASSKGNEIISYLELAEATGMSTGVVSTARLTHATPAATYAKSPERGWEDDRDLTDEAKQNGCKDIARQLIEFPFGDGVEVAMGGGRRSFIPSTMDDQEDAGKTGERDDGRDLTKEWVDNNDNAAFVWNKDQFDSINPANTDHLLGLFERSHMEFELDRADDTGGEPSLTEMTAKSIDILKKNNKGYFLMVESGRIDHAHHGGNAQRSLEDNIEFAKAVQMAVDKTSAEDTLIIVTADHSHVFTIAGYPTRGNDILGKVMVNGSDGLPSGELALDAFDLPFTTLGYANGPGYLGGETRVDLTNVDTTATNYLQEATVPLSSETHSGEDVAIYARGPGAYLIDGVLEQNAIFHVMARQNSRINNALSLIGSFGSGKSSRPTYNNFEKMHYQLAESTDNQQ